MTATAHLQDDGTFVLKPKNPYHMYIGNLNPEWKAFDDAHPRILTDNKNLTDGQEVDLYDYSKVEQILTKDGYRDLQWWEIKTFDEKKKRKQFALRTILRLRSEIVSPLSDEREKDDNGWIKIKYIPLDDMTKFRLINEHGDTYTSKSDELRDFIAISQRIIHPTSKQ